MTDDDPYLEALRGIWAELQGIRIALQQQAIEADDESDAERYQCESCGYEAVGSDDAKTHAENEHDAPADAWVHLMRSQGTPDDTNQE